MKKHATQKEDDLLLQELVSRDNRLLLAEIQRQLDLRERQDLLLEEVLLQLKAIRPVSPPRS